MKIIRPQATHDIYGGVIEGKDVAKYKKLFGQIQTLYHDPSGISPDTLMYTVYSYEAGSAEKKGDLYWGLTILEPVTINGECNMTRGHFHLDRNCAEFYFGIGGKGLLLLMDENGDMWAEKVFKGSLHHIDGTLAHRLVNTGNKRLKVGACWPTTAGHDYAAIERRDFLCRVIKEGGEIVFRER